MNAIFNGYGTNDGKPVFLGPFTYRATHPDLGSSEGIQMGLSNPPSPDALPPAYDAPLPPSWNLLALAAAGILTRRKSRSPRPYSANASP